MLHSLKKMFKSNYLFTFGVIICLFWIIMAIIAPMVAPYDPVVQDLTLRLKAPSAAHIFGTDNFGRDIFSRVLGGAGTSFLVALAVVAIGCVFGLLIGGLCGYYGGAADAVIMRFCDVMLSFPAILLALLIDGIIRVILPESMHDQAAYGVLIFAISLSGWVRYARTVRGATLSEKKRDYVQAAKLFGVSPTRIMFTHILPNVLGPVLVLATVQVALAIITEATLSFLGVGVPPTTPSLGTLIRIGNEFLFSGEWWITIFPGVALILFVLSVNMLGDWLRDALNPKLQ